MPEGGTLLVLGLGPIGDMASRIALHQGRRVIGVDRVPERLARVEARGAEVIDLSAVDDVGEEVRSRTEGRGADAVVDAVGMEAHGSPVAEFGQRLFNVLPKRLSASIMNKAGLDRMSAIYTAIDAVRRGGTVSLDRGLRRSVRPDADAHDVRQAAPVPDGAGEHQAVGRRHHAAADRRCRSARHEEFATHQVPLDDAPAAYENFQKKQDGTIKVVFKPHLT